MPSAHDGHRLIAFGGLLYMIGGFTFDTTRGWEASNAMWAADLAGFFANVTNGPGDPGATLPWVRVQPINSPGVFSGRGAFSLNTYSGTILLFGGLTRALPGPNGPDPVCALPGSACVAFNDRRKSQTNNNSTWVGKKVWINTTTIRYASSKTGGSTKWLITEHPVT